MNAKDSPEEDQATAFTQQPAVSSAYTLPNSKGSRKGPLFTLVPSMSASNVLNTLKINTEYSYFKLDSMYAQ